MAPMVLGKKVVKSAYECGVARVVVLGRWYDAWTRDVPPSPPVDRYVDLPFIRGCACACVCVCVCVCDTWACASRFGGVEVEVEVWVGPAHRTDSWRNCGTAELRDSESFWIDHPIPLYN